MPRQRLSVNGPQIARPGFDVDTASPENMLFDPRFIAASVYATNIVTTTAFDDFTNRYVGSHGRTFPMPPIVIPYEVVGSERRLHLARFAQFFGNVQAQICAGSTRVTTTGFELYSGNSTMFNLYPPGTTWRYVTLSNTLANS